MATLNEQFEMQYKDIMFLFEAEDNILLYNLFEAEDTPSSKAMESINLKYKRLLEQLKMKYEAQKSKLKENKQKEVNALKMKKAKGKIQ